MSLPIPHAAHAHAHARIYVSLVTTLCSILIRISHHTIAQLEIQIFIPCATTKGGRCGGMLCGG